MKKNNINKLKIAVSALFCLLIFTGCGRVPHEDKDVLKLKQELCYLVEENSNRQFNKRIDTNDFDISLAEKTRSDTFETVETLNTKNEVYLIGHYEGKPNEVVEFVMSYDIKTNRTTSFGIQTIKDKDIVYTK